MVRTLAIVALVATALTAYVAREATAQGVSETQCIVKCVRDNPTQPADKCKAQCKGK